VENSTTTCLNSGMVKEQLVAWIGLDWADNQHQVSLHDIASGQVESYGLKHSPETLQRWLDDLRKRYNGGKVAVVLEQSRGAVLYALMNCDFVVLYPVNPHGLASYRKALYTSGAKDDPTDATLLMDMVRKHPERFRAWVPEDPNTRSLRLMVEARRKLVNQLTRCTNQLTSHLKSYFPQAIEWAGDLDSWQACDFFEQWPTLEALQQARPSRLRKFYYNYGRPRVETIDARLEQIKQAVPLTVDPAAVLTGSMMVRALVAQIRPLLATVEEFDDEIKRLFQKHPDRQVFESLPGAGAVLAPRLLAAVGADRERWESAAEVQTFSGIAPVTEQSGKKRFVHRRFACSKFVRQTFHEFAGSSIVWCDWAKAYYDHLIAHGKGRHTALRALAYKWIRILFACWKNRTPYQEEIFLKALEQRGSPLSQLARAAQQVKATKKRVA
jgi:transposase